MASKRTVIWLIETLNRGGTENVLLRLIPYLEQAGWHSIVLTVKDGGEMLAQYQAANITVETLNLPAVWQRRSIKAIAAAINRQHADVVVTNLFRCDVVGRLFLPRLITVPISSFIVTTYNDRRYFPARAFEWLTRPFARHYIANSPAVKDFFVDRLGVNEKKICVIPNSLDAEVFKKASPDSVIKELKLPKDRLVVSCVANLAPNKGQAVLMKAFERAFGSQTNAFLLLVGDGEQREALEAQRQQCRSRDRIFLLGRRTDVPALLKASDIFAFPTLFEGMSTALLEAMAARLAIATTNIPENKAILTDRKTALLFPPRDTTALTKILRRLAENQKLRQTLGQAAQSEVGKNYTVTVCARQFADQFNRYVSGKD